MVDCCYAGNPSSPSLSPFSRIPSHSNKIPSAFPTQLLFTRIAPQQQQLLSLYLFPFSSFSPSSPHHSSSIHTVLLFSLLCSRRIPVPDTSLLQKHSFSTFQTDPFYLLQLASPVDASVSSRESPLCRRLRVLGGSVGSGLGVSDFDLDLRRFQTPRLEIKVPLQPQAIPSYSLFIPLR